MVVQILWLSRSYNCPDLMVVQILWLSRSYDCPDLMIVRYSCMLSFISFISFISYGCPDLMVVHILWLSTSYGLTLWLSGSYGYILWYLMVVRWHLMVVHVDGCPVDGCPLTFPIYGQFCLVRSVKCLYAHWGVCLRSQNHNLYFLHPGTGLHS